VRRDVGDFGCGLAIRRSDGLMVAGTNTFLDHITVPGHLPGEIISIRYTIDSLPLLTGGYLAHLTVHHRKGEVYDHADPAASFQVNNTGGHVGLLEMHGRWQVEREEDVSSSGAVRQSAR